MSIHFITIVAIVSMIIWITVSRELVNSSEEKNERKIITLMCAGSLSTLILTISLIQRI